MDKLWQSFWKLKFMKNQALELHSPLPKSFKVCKERTMEKRKNRVKRKTEDSSCSLLAHFWSTSRSSFSTCYIPFQSLGSQQSNDSNGAQFGVETKKLQPLQVNYSKLKKALCKSVAKSPFCCEVISQPFCTVWWFSS